MAAGEPEGEELRGHTRVPADLDLTLTEPGGGPIDKTAKALDVNPEGFRAVCRVPLKKGMRLRFTMSLQEGLPVGGEAEVVWVREDGWGGSEAGLRITNLSWSDARRLRGKIYEPGFDFARIAWLGAKAAFLIVLVVGFQQMLFGEPHIRTALLDALPALAVAIVGVGVAYSLIHG